MQLITATVTQLMFPLIFMQWNIHTNSRNDTNLLRKLLTNQRHDEGCLPHLGCWTHMKTVTFKLNELVWSDLYEWQILLFAIYEWQILLFDRQSHPDKDRIKLEKLLASDPINVKKLSSCLHPVLNCNPRLRNKATPSFKEIFYNNFGLWY